MTGAWAGRLDNLALHFRAPRRACPGRWRTSKDGAGGPSAGSATPGASRGSLGPPGRGAARRRPAHPPLPATRRRGWALFREARRCLGTGWGALNNLGTIQAGLNTYGGCGSALRGRSVELRRGPWRSTRPSRWVAPRRSATPRSRARRRCRCDRALSGEAPGLRLAQGDRAGPGWPRRSAGGIGEHRSDAGGRAVRAAPPARGAAEALRTASPAARLLSRPPDPLRGRWPQTQALLGDGRAPNMSKPGGVS